MVTGEVSKEAWSKDKIVPVSELGGAIGVELTVVELTPLGTLGMPMGVTKESLQALEPV